MRERHVHATRAADDFDLCIEVLRECLDEGRAQSALRRSVGDIRFPDSIVGHDKLPVRSIDLVADDDLTVLCVLGKSVFQSVDHELGDDKAEADGLGGLDRPPLTRTCSEIGRRSRIIEAARLSHSLDR